MPRLPPWLILSGALFLSGASAIVFETLWFRQAGFTFGNSVWATTLVLCSFMGGLALGNALAGRSAHRVTRPVRLYVLLELAIAGLGFGLVLLLPALPGLLAPVFRPLTGEPLLLNTLRLLFAAVLMLLPATAMGATLPFLVGALSAADPRFGAVLGRLYGFNTLGAVAGALVSEVVLVERFGLRGAGLCAAALNLGAAGIVVLSRATATAPPPPAATTGPLTTRARRVLIATAICGALLLALEVVWFRFLMLFVVNTSHALALLLAVVLLGIALGGLAGGWLAARGGAPAASLLALAAGILVPTLYAAMTLAGAGDLGLSTDAGRIVRLAVVLMLPVSIVSGMLFTLLGQALQAELPDATRAAGLLTLANTAGSMLGAVLGGFVLLPGVGMEGAFFLLALGYGAVALAAWSRPARALARATAVAAAFFAARLALFPFGLMEEKFLVWPTRLYATDGSKTIAVREGLTETVLYLEKRWLGQPLYRRMLTNGFSMSSTQTFARRYMKLFVYWPIAAHPNPKKALLISYGVGSTAKALTDTKGLAQIDVVDISADVLALGKLVYPDPGTAPLDDPRVKVHLEDGRQFLLTTGERYDVITAEPPPPKNAGIVNLYTREYFALLRDRLAEGGLVTYWLPVHDLLEADTKAIIRGFCDAFDDCALWNGSGLDWMLVGSRNAAPLNEDALRRQWADPTVAPELEGLGFEGPEQLGALFLAGPGFLRTLTEGTEPLVDDFPRRLRDVGTPALWERAGTFHTELMDASAARARFVATEADRWPYALREAAVLAFDVQAILNRRLLPDHFHRPFVLDFADLHRALTKTPYRVLPLWLMGSSVDEQRIAQTTATPDAEAQLHLAILDLARREYGSAIDRLAPFKLKADSDPRFVHLRAYALCLANRGAEVPPIYEAWARLAKPDPAFWNWLAATFGVTLRSDPR